MRPLVLISLLCAFAACSSKIGRSSSPGTSSGETEVPDAGTATLDVPDAGTVTLAFDRVVFGAKGCSVTVHADNTYLSDGGLSVEHEFFTNDALQLYLRTPDAGWVQVDWPATPNGDSSQCRSDLLGSPYALVLTRADLLDMVSYLRGGVVLEGTLTGDLVVDLSHPLFARPHVYGASPIPPSGGATVTFSGDSAGFTPAFTRDWLFLYSPEAGAEVQATQVTDDAGTVSYADPISFDFAKWMLGPIDASMGDSTYLLDRSWVEGDGGSFIAVTRAGRVPGFSIDGGWELIDVDLQPLTLDHSVKLTIDRPAFEALLTPVWPGPVDEIGGEGIVDAFPPEALMTNVELADGNFLTGSTVQLAYAPLVPGLPLEARVDFARGFDLAPGIRAQADLMAELPLDAVPDLIEPVIGPVQQLQINGLDALQPHSGVGTMPVVSWRPPAFGTAAEYQVSFHWINDGYTSGTDTPSIFTTETQVLVPPDYLTPGVTYSVTVSALASGTRDAAHPLRKTLPEYRADALSAPFTP